MQLIFPYKKTFRKKFCSYRVKHNGLHAETVRVMSLVFCCVKQSNVTQFHWGCVWLLYHVCMLHLSTKYHNEAERHWVSQ